MKNKINIALQVLPTSENKNVYQMVDIAIAVIQNSGLKYKVCPFETVIEGEYDEVMNLVKNVHEVLYQNGTKSMIANLKIQTSAVNDVTIEDKMEKYE